MKFMPHITIWELDVMTLDGISIVRSYYLSFHAAKRAWEKNKESWKDYQVTIGGEPLWFW